MTSQTITVYADVEVEVDLSEFNDDAITEEYNSRGLADSDRCGDDDIELMNKIWIHDREGRKDQAYALMREYVYDKLNKVV